MKQVTLQELLKMPEGTIFTQYSYNSDLTVFGGQEFEYNDFAEFKLSCVHIDNWDNYKVDCEELDKKGLIVHDGNEAVAMIEDYGRWGIFDKDATFYVYDAEDLEYIRSQIDNGIKAITEYSSKIDKDVDLYLRKTGHKFCQHGEMGLILEIDKDKPTPERYFEFIPDGEWLKEYLNPNKPKPM